MHCLELNALNKMAPLMFLYVECPEIPQWTNKIAYDYLKSPVLMNERPGNLI